MTMMQQRADRLDEFRALRFRKMRPKEKVMM